SPHPAGLTKRSSSMTASTKLRRRFTASLAILASATLLASCTSNTPAEAGGDGGNQAAAEAGSNDEVGETVTIGFSAPAADHGWMAAMTTLAQVEADQYEDIDLLVAEGTNDVNQQISQVETFINNDEIDAIVVVPFDGAALTDVALQAMRFGISVVNVDREFSDPNASVSRSSVTTTAWVSRPASTSASGSATIRMPWWPIS